MSQLTLIVGRQFSGKSTTIAENITKIPGPTVIMDPGRAKAYTEKGIQFVEPSQVYRLAKGIVRVRDMIDKGKVISQIFGFNKETGEIDYAKAFVNGNLILEDAGSYMDSNLTRELKSCVKAFKQFGLNLFLAYHSFDEIGIDIIRLQPQFVWVKKTGDSEKVFSKNPAMTRMPNQGTMMKHYYRAAFHGLTPEKIEEVYRLSLPGMARDLGISGKDLARRLCLWAHDGKTPSAAQQRMANYHTEYANLRGL